MHLRRVRIPLRDSSQACLAAAEGEAALRECSDDEVLDEACLDGMTPLHVAAAFGRLDSVRYLTRQYSLLPVDAVDEKGRSALWLAAANGEKEIIELLLLKGADPTMANSEGETPLHVAVLHGWHETAKCLVQEEPDLLTVGTRGSNHTALHYAIAAVTDLDDPILGLDCMDVLLSHERTDALAVDTRGRTALSLACERGADDAVDKLLHYAPEALAVVDEEGRTVLHWAVMGRGSERVLPQLLTQSVDLAQTADRTGLTPLHLAALKGDLMAIRLLLRAGASAGSVDREGRTPLHAAATADQDGLVCEELLHASDASVDQPDAHGRSALLHAARSACLPALTTLLAAKASVRALDESESGALFWAAMTSSKACLKALLHAGADVNAANTQGWTALHAAASRDHDEQINFLVAKAAADPLKANALGWTPLHLAASRGHAESVERLLRASSMLDKPAPITLAGARDLKGRTPLHLAAKQGHTEVVELLLEFGADPNATDAQGRNAVHYAAHARTAGPLELLLGASAKCSVQDKRGRTALHVAAALGHSRLCSMLLEDGAARAEQDEAGRTPLHYAAFRGHAEAVQAIISEAEVTVADRNGRTALHHAVLGTGYEEARILSVLAPLSATARDWKGRTPVHYAAALNRPMLLELLLQSSQDGSDGSDDEGVEDEDEESSSAQEVLLPPAFAIADTQNATPLHLAAAAGAEAAMENLARVASAELLNALDSRKRTALRLALEGAVRGLPGAEDCALALVRRSKTCVRGLGPLSQSAKLSADLREALTSGTSPSPSPAASPRVSPQGLPRAAVSPSSRLSPNASPRTALSPRTPLSVSPRLVQNSTSPRTAPLPRTPPLSAPRQAVDADRLRAAEEREQRALVVAAEETAYKQAQAAEAAKRQEPLTTVRTVAPATRTPAENPPISGALYQPDPKPRDAPAEPEPHECAIASLRDQLAAANQRNADLATKLALESQERARLVAHVESMSAELHRARQVQAECEALQQLSASQKATIASLQSDNTNLTARLSALNAGDPAVSGELAKAKAKLAYAQERIEDLRRALS